MAVLPVQISAYLVAKVVARRSAMPISRLPTHTQAVKFHGVEHIQEEKLLSNMLGDEQ